MKSVNSNGTKSSKSSFGRVFGKVIGGLVFLIVVYFGWRALISKDNSLSNSNPDFVNQENQTFDAPDGDDSETPIKPSAIKLSDGQQITGVGYFAEILKERKIDAQNTLVLIKSVPCGECDAPAELVLYSTKNRKTATASMPGKYTFAESKDPDQIVFGFFGPCQDANQLSLITLQKYKEGQGPWKADQISIQMNEQGFEQKQINLDVQDIESLRKKFSQTPHCEEIKAEDQSYL